MSKRLLKVFREGNNTVFLGSLAQCSRTLKVKKEISLSSSSNRGNECDYVLAKWALLNLSHSAYSLSSLKLDNKGNRMNIPKILADATGCCKSDWKCTCYGLRSSP